MRIAVCPGSFDPVTLGHIDIINRAAKLFDKVIVLVSYNPNKATASFSVEERMQMIMDATNHLDNVVVDCNSGLLADYLKRTGACAIVKGLRAVSDFEYEFQMALANKKLYDEAETVFLTTTGENMFLSSSVVKEIASFGGDIDGFVPECILQRIKDRLFKDDNTKF
ncbi:MAG: pantetheine-phosphate adenylyltransferase [Hominimerdicola sp.]